MNLVRLSDTKSIIKIHLDFYNDSKHLVEENLYCARELKFCHNHKNKIWTKLQEE